MKKEPSHYIQHFNLVESYSGTLKFFEASVELSELTKEEMCELLVIWFETIRLDAKAVRSVVASVGALCSRLAGIDKPLLEFYLSPLDDKKAEILFIFLMRYWESSKGIENESVKLLEKILGSLKVESNSYNYGLQALCMIADPILEIDLGESTRESLRERLVKICDNVPSEKLASNTIRALSNLQNPVERKLFRFFSDANRTSHDILAGEEKSVIVVSLLSWLDSVLLASYDGEDKLYACGKLIGSALGKEIDSDIIDWLNDNTSVGKISVATHFLVGYWQRSGGATDLCLEQLESLKNHSSISNVEHSQLKDAIEAGKVANSDPV